MNEYSGSKFGGPRNIFEEAVQYVQFVIENYGWTILFSAIFFFSIKPYLSSYMEKLSREHANRPERKGVLDEEVKRVRAMQQLDVYKASRETKYSEEDGLQSKKGESENGSSPSKSNTKPKPSPSKKPPTSGSTYNPLTGMGGQVSSFRPSGEMRNMGRRRGG